MPITMTRAVQVPLPLAGPPAGATAASPSRRHAPRALPRPRPAPRFCDNCRGPIARGEGFLTCVVCGRHRAA
jgi:hypothetical protein